MKQQYEYLPKATILEISQRFEAKVPGLIGQSLVFGFIFGGFAKGYATISHDIDMFICVRHLDADSVSRFRHWYFDIHREFRLTPDLNDPGEVLTLADLEKRIAFLEITPLRKEIETYYEYEAIVWADVMSEAKIAIVGDVSELAELEFRCKELAKRWRNEVRAILGVENEDAIANLDLRRLFKKAITYLKKNPPPRLANNPPPPRWAKP